MSHVSHVSHVPWSRTSWRSSDVQVFDDARGEKRGPPEGKMAVDELINPWALRRICCRKSGKKQRPCL